MNNNPAHKKALKYLNAVNSDKNHSEEAVQMVSEMITHGAWMNPDYKWSLDDFELGYRLGRGRFGRVYLAREKKTKFLVAIKMLQKKEIVMNKVEETILREIEIQSHLKHENILRLFAFFQDDFRIYVILEYAHKGELFTHLKKSPNKRFNEQRSAKYIYQVADALHYCHQNNVIHRDIKPENLLLTHDDNIKISDFGWSRHAFSKRNTFCGTTDYVAPELISREVYDCRIDNWCLGILCYEFLCGYPPFESDDNRETFMKIRSLAFTYPAHITSEAKDLISKLVVLNAEKRLSLPDVTKHTWIIKNK